MVLIYIDVSRDLEFSCISVMLIFITKTVTIEY